MGAVMMNSLNHGAPMVLVALSLLTVTQADLPVHCPHHTLVGNWEFSMSQGNQPKSLSCNMPPAQPKLSFFGFSFKNKVLGKPRFKTDMKWKVSLANPNIALVTDDKGAQ